MKMRKRLLVSARLAAAARASVKEPSVGTMKSYRAFCYCRLLLGGEAEGNVALDGIVGQVGYRTCCESEGIFCCVAQTLVGKGDGLARYGTGQLLTIEGCLGVFSQFYFLIECQYNLTIG